VQAIANIAQGAPDAEALAQSIWAEILSATSDLERIKNDRPA
jgi:hypothetical protein